LYSKCAESSEDFKSARNFVVSVAVFEIKAFLWWKNSKCYPWESGKDTNKQIAC
jgi:hypothetical protein